MKKEWFQLTKCLQFANLEDRNAVAEWDAMEKKKGGPSLVQLLLQGFLSASWQSEAPATLFIRYREKSYRIIFEQIRKL